jgi:hypothetical protein
MQATDTSEGTPRQVSIDYKNLVVGKQDPDLFEIPPGYQKFAVPSMGSLPPGGGAPPGGQVDPEEMRRQLQEQLQQMMRQMGR